MRVGPVFSIRMPRYVDHELECISYTLQVWAAAAWGFEVDETVFANLPRHERNRQQAIFELIISELQYTNDLSTVVEAFNPQRCASVCFYTLHSLSLEDCSRVQLIPDPLRHRVQHLHHPAQGPSALLYIY